MPAVAVVSSSARGSFAGVLRSLVVIFLTAIVAGPSGVTSGDVTTTMADLDDDGDGVPNASDLCPGTAPAAAVDVSGCSDAQVDSDGDGVCSVTAPSGGPSGCTGLDGCPATAAPPVSSGGCSDADVDPDSDGICTPLGRPPGPSSCTGADNCPLAANPGQEDANGNGIGDACEAPGDAGDSDGDGVSDLNEAGIPLCANAVNDDNLDDGLVNDGCPAFGLPESDCANALDDDGDDRVNDGCPRSGQFAEGQFNIGTNHLARCGVGDEGAAVPSDAWSVDLYSGGVPNSTDRINVLDFTSFVAPAGSRRLNTSPGETSYTARWDLIPGRGPFLGWINVTDLTAILTGSSGVPPMFGGLGVFHGPYCSAHPVYGD